MGGAIRKTDGAKDEISGAVQRKYSISPRVTFLKDWVRRLVVYSFPVSCSSIVG